jgi:hypothetical protein
MFTDTHIPETAVATADTSPTPEPQTPTTTFYQKAVDDFMKALDGIIAALPDVQFTAAHPSTRNFVRTHQNVPLPFLASAIASVEQDNSLQGTQTFDTVAARDKLQLIDAFTTLLERVTAFRDTVSYTVAVNRAELSALCLQIYGVAKQLARHSGASTGPISLTTHVHTMKQHLGKKGTRRKASPAPQPPARQTPPPTPQVPEPHGNAAQA